MHAQLGIPEPHLEAIGLLLNTLLADEQVLFAKTKYYHWNVEGETFHQLHTFFDDQAEQLEEVIDQVAERTRSLGHYAIGTLKDFLSLTRLLETKDAGGEAATMVQNLLFDHETLIRQLRTDIVATADYGDAGTSDFLTGLLETHEKMAWMLRAHLPKKRQASPAREIPVVHAAVNPALTGQ
jgi:starvation-inducible DNA-binding protein